MVVRVGSLHRHASISMACAAFIATSACSMRARAQPVPTIDVSVVDAAVIATAAVGTFAFSRLPVAPSKWQSEPFFFDEGTRGVQSTTHSTIADALVLSSVVVPVAAGAARDDDERAPKLVVYAESLAVAGLLNGIAKYVVQRPRPHSYGISPEATAYTESRGADAYLSFFSGHATMAFTSAVAGSYLYAYGNNDTTSRAILWGVEMALASATATERVRAGKHFPSDVVVGAAVGTGVGLLVPRAHMSDRSAVSMSIGEWLAIGSGLVVGTTTSLLLPPLRSDRTTAGGVEMALTPTFAAGGAGISASGRF